MRSDQKRFQRNVSEKSQLKTLSRKLEKWIQAKELDQAKAGFAHLTSRLDKAVKRGILHRNTASRKKGRFARLLANLPLTNPT